MATQILVCGDVNGKLGRLYQRVRAVDKAHGPFAFCVCVGEFFPAEDMMNASSEPGVDIAKYITGEEKAPMPTYFLGGEDKDGLLGMMNDNQELCPNITYLGKHGIASLHGLKIGFVSGFFHDPTEQQRADEWAPSTDAEKDAAERKRKMVTDLALLTADEEFGGVDALFTNQWARGITQGVPADVSARPENPSGTITVASAMLRPRYHFAGTEGLAWSRVPYASQAAAHVARFVALGKVSLVKGGAKFLHALKIAPMATMAAAELETTPPGTTRDPFAAISAGLIKGGAPKRALPSSGGGGGGFGGGGGGGNMCFDFQKGQCQRGDSCKFSHDPNAANAKRPRAAAGAVIQDRVYIGNITYQCTEEELRQFLGAVGVVQPPSL